MSDDVIVIYATEDYLPHAQSLMVNCRRQGNWQGDFCLLTPPGYRPADMTARGIDVMEAPDGEGLEVRFWLFSDYFRKWNRLLGLDCDVLVQGDLNAAFDGLAEKLPAIVFDGGQQPEEGSVQKNWEYFDDNFGKGPGPAAHPELYERLRARFPCMDKLTYTVDVMFFSPQAVPAGAFDEMRAVTKEFAATNTGHYDQPIMVAVLYDHLVPMTKEFCCWFAFDEPCNRLAARGWRGDEEPAILHYISWFAPWIKKEPGAGAHYNHRLGRVCHELYAENLAAFDEVFPIQ